MDITKLVLASLLTLSAIGCSPQTQAPSSSDASTPASSASAAADSDVSVTPPTAAALNAVAAFAVDPAEMRECDKPRVATLSWDASSVAGLQQVEIWISGPNKAPKLFGLVPKVGQKQTGAWIHAGAVIEFKNKADNAELARLEVKSIPCN